jgi:hypothetical protein
MMEYGSTETRPGLSSKPIISKDAPRDELLARVRQLEAVLFNTRWVPLEWNLTLQEECALNVIAASNRPVPAAALYDTLFGLRVDGGPEQPIVRVIITKLRRKLAPYGIVIPSLQGHPGAGYRFAPESRAIVNALRGAR